MICNVKTRDNAIWWSSITTTSHKIYWDNYFLQKSYNPHPPLQNFCNWLYEPEKIYWKGTPDALSYLKKNIVCLRFYQDKRGILTFQSTQSNQNKSLK